MGHTKLCLQTSQPAHCTRPPPTIFSAYNWPSLMTMKGAPSGPGPCSGAPELTLCPTLGCTELRVSLNTNRKGRAVTGSWRDQLSQCQGNLGCFGGSSCPLPFYWKRELEVLVEAGWRSSTQGVKEEGEGIWVLAQVSWPPHKERCSFFVAYLVYHLMGRTGWVCWGSEEQDLVWNPVCIVPGRP